MKRSRIIAVTCALVVGATGLMAGQDIQVETEIADCKFLNTSKSAILYTGECKVTTKEKLKQSLILSIEMGEAPPVIFLTTDGKTWTHNGQGVETMKLGVGTKFKWGEFSLSIAGNQTQKKSKI